MRLMPSSMPYRLLPAIALLGLLVGCALPSSRLDIPRADNYPASGQQKARAVHHWEVLASDVATRLADKLSEWPTDSHPIHITIDQESSFNQGFIKLLRIHLLQRGVTLSPAPGELELQIQTQVVQHASGAGVNPPLPWTALATGIGVARDWYMHYYGRVLAPGVTTALGLGTGLTLDWWRQETQGTAAGGPTRTEVLISTTLKSSTRYLTGTADLYYIEVEDKTLYQPPPPPPPPPPPMKTWQVVAP